MRMRCFRQGQSAPLTPHETRLRPGIGFPTGRRAAISDLDQACAPETGVQRNRSCLVGIRMIKEALGQGISILPARTMQAEIEQGRLVAVKLNAPGLARPLGIVHRRRKKFNRATERLLAMLMASPA